jgi:hypothetical protein
VLSLGKKGKAAASTLLLVGKKGKATAASTQLLPTERRPGATV